MSLYVMLKPDFIFEDERGVLAQLVHDGFKQINVLFSKQGVTRGNHFHKRSTEAFYVVNGTVEVTFKKAQDTETVIFTKGAFFSISPLVSHSMLFLDDCTMIQMYDTPVLQDNGEKDIFTF